MTFGNFLQTFEENDNNPEDESYHTISCHPVVFSFGFYFVAKFIRGFYAESLN